MKIYNNIFLVKFIKILPIYYYYEFIIIVLD